jgi:SAM-dependent methyltransferase
LEPAIAHRFSQARTRSFAELGAATGPISRLLTDRGVRCVTFDLHPLGGALRPLVRGDLRHLPFVPGSLDGISAVNCLYFLGEPTRAVAEAWQTLREGGLFLASTPSRYQDPELAEAVPGWGAPSPFDAEEAAELVASVSDDVEEEWWEEPAYRLSNRAAVIDYLVAFKHPQPEEIADRLQPPLTITKSGVNVWARRQG